MTTIKITTAPFFLQNLKRNQIAGLWLFFGSRRCFDWVAPTALQFLFWGLAGCAANTLFGWLSTGGQGYFNFHGLVSYLLWPFVALIVGIFLSQRTELERIMLVPALLWLVLDTHLMLLQSLLQFLGNQDLLPYFTYSYIPHLFLILFLWQSMALVLVFSRALSWPWWERVLIVIATLLTLGVWQYSIKDQPVWKMEEYVPTLTDKALFAQSKLLQDGLDQLQPSNYLESQWYFMGVAGASYQNVFRSEIERIKAQFDTRFGTVGRSIALINNDATIEELPIATPISIERAFNRIGSVMNRDSDVLFLYMTSHGLANQFELSNEPIAMDPINPKWLREKIDAAGIRWRVIVISSCYSGSFIQTLKSPDTLIITAAASDRESFGCTNEADYTYFGRAFFDEAMREQSTFKSAFDQASTTVAKWEAAQGFLASEPQWVIGENMKLMLPQLEKKLFPQTSFTVPKDKPIFLPYKLEQQ